MRSRINRQALKTWAIRAWATRGARWRVARRPSIIAGRRPAVEILRGNAVTEKLILENRLDEISAHMEIGESGMRTFDQHLLEMFDQELIRTTEALRCATRPEALSRQIHGIKGK